MDTSGKMVTCDVWLEEMPELIQIKRIAEAGIDSAHMHVVDFLQHNFKPYGETLVWVLSESHLSMHTYPEEKYISIDCYTCGKEGNPKRCIDKILSFLKVKIAKTNEIQRGHI